MDKPFLNTPHQKLGLVVVVVIGLTTLIFGVISLRKSIFLPFVRRPSGIVFKTSEQLEKERMESLKHKDTDSDTLTDYDELYIFRTSPFLEDTDSDGDPDGVEVNAGTDPNCPKDKVCRQPRTTQTAGTEQPSGVPDVSVPPETSDTSGTAPSTTVVDDQNAALAQVLTETFGPAEDLTPEMVEAKMQSMTTAELRAFYVKLGIPASAVEQADDATLRQVFLETLRDIGMESGAEPAVPGATGTPPDATQ